MWTDGSREDYPTGGFEVAGVGVYLPASEEATWGEPSGVLRRNMVVLDWRPAVPLCRSRALFSRFSVLNFGVRFWLCRSSCRGTLVLIISMWSGPMVGFGRGIWVTTTLMLLGLLLGC